MSESQNIVGGYVESLVESGAIKIAPDIERPFTLRNGTTSVVYVDHGDMLCQPETLAPFQAALADHITVRFPEDSTVLCNVDSKSSPHIAGALASSLGLRQIIVSPQSTQLAEKGRGLRCRIPKNIRQSDTVVIVDDVFTEDDVTAIGAASVVRDTLKEKVGPDEPEVHLLVGLLRGDPVTCIRQLGRHGINLHYLTVLDEVIARAWSVFGSQAREVLVRGGFNSPASSS